GAAEGVPSPEFVGVAMEGISTALSNHVDDGTGVAAILGSEVVGDNAKFLGGIRSCAEHAAQTTGNRGVVVVYAVEQEVIVAFAGTVHRDAAQPAVGHCRSR